MSFDRRPLQPGRGSSSAHSSPATPGKRTLAEATMAREAAPVQRSVSAHNAAMHQVDGGAIQRVAATGVANAGGPLPHGNTIFDELTDPTRAQSEAEYRAKFQIPEGTPLSKKALKAINRVLDRFIEKQMWKRVGEKVAASSQKVGEVILEEGGRFSDGAGKFAVVADANKISLKGGTAPVVDALVKQGVTAEPVVVEAAEALATKMKWAGRVRGVFRYGGKVLIVVGVAVDLIQIYRAHDRLKATLTSVGGWAGATAAGAAFAAYWTPADVAGPWAWVGHGVGTLVAGGIGYWFGSTVTRNIYELAAE